MLLQSRAFCPSFVGYQGAAIFGVQGVDAIPELSLLVVLLLVLRRIGTNPGVTKL